MAVEAFADQAVPEPVVGVAWPPARVAWYAMIVLALVRLSAQLDFGILSLLAQPIKQDLHLSDDAIGLLLGFAFTLFMPVVGIPLSALVDTRSRRTILLIGVTVWSSVTALTGLAGNFWQLFLCRMGVGASESVNGPATFSMIADFFPRERLPRAIAVMTIGSMFGIGLSLVLGGVVIKALAHMGPFVLPLVGPVHYWQLVFVAIGLPGLLASLLMLTVGEPARRGVKKARQPLGAVVPYLRDHWRIFAPMFAGVVISGMESQGAQMWRPAFFQRTYGWAPADAGLWTGVAFLVTSPIGLLFGAYLAEWLARRHDDSNLRVVVISWVVATPLMIASTLVSNAWVAVVVSGLAGMVALMAGPTQNAAIQSVTPNEMRGQMTALYLLSYTLAQGAGPSLIAFVTDHVIGSEAALRYAMAWTVLAGMPFAVIAILLGLKPYGNEVARLKREGL